MDQLKLVRLFMPIRDLVKKLQYMPKKECEKLVNEALWGHEWDAFRDHLRWH
jgi:hypothetical protein